MQINLQQLTQWVVMGIGLGLGERIFNWLYHFVLH